MGSESTQDKAGPELAGSTRKWLVKQLIALAIPVAVLFAASGRLDWTLGWAYVAVFFVGSGLTAVILLRTSPDLAKDRSQLQKGTKTWDLVAAPVMVYSIVATWVVAGLDARFAWSAAPHFRSRCRRPTCRWHRLRVPEGPGAVARA